MNGSIYASGGNVYVGYWSGSLERPFTKRFDALIHILHIVPEELEGQTFDEEQRDLQMVTRNLYPKIKFTSFTGTGNIEGIDVFVKCEYPDLLAFYKHPGNLYYKPCGIWPLPKR
jgi:hypothetical protein